MAVTSDGTPYVEPGDAISAYPVVSQELAAVIDSLRTMIPVGAIFPYAGKTAPEGYLMCDGKAYTRTDFYDLFMVMAEWVGEWGGWPGGNTSQFFVPDFRGRSPMGVGGGGGGGSATGDQAITLGRRDGHQRPPFHTHSSAVGDPLSPDGSKSHISVRGGPAGGGAIYTYGPHEALGDEYTSYLPENLMPITGVNFIVWTGTTTAGKNPVPGVELAPVTTRMMIEARLEEAGIGEEEIEMLREQLAALKEGNNG